MKKIFAVALVAMMTMTANAQVYVGGGIGFQTSSNDGNSETTIKILPEIGYNLDENWAVGIAVGYGENQTKINVFVDGTVDYAHADADGLKSNSFGVGVKPGVAVNLNDKLSFVTHFGFLGYQYDKLDVDGAKATNTFGFDLDGNNLTFGLYYNF